MTQVLPVHTAVTTSVDPGPASRATRGVGTVLVTGAASGLGRAVAAAVTAAGGRALLADRVPVEDASEGALTAVADLADARHMAPQDLANWLAKYTK